MVTERLSMPLRASRPSSAGGSATRRLIGARPAHPGSGPGAAVPVLPAAVHPPDELHRGQLVPVADRSGLDARQLPPHRSSATCRTCSSRVQLALLATVVDLVLRLPVRLHPRAPGPLPRRRPGADGVPDVRRAVRRVRDALHPAARWPARRRCSSALGIPGTVAAVQPAVGRVRDVDLHVPVHGHEHRDGAVATSTRRSRRRPPASARGRGRRSDASCCR